MILADMGADVIKIEACPAGATIFAATRPLHPDLKPRRAVSVE